MFNNPGEKLKNGAYVLFFIDLIGNLFLGVFLWNNIWDIHWAIFFIATAIVSYFTCLVLYGFGELVENSSQVKDGASPNYTTYADNSSPKNEVNPAITTPEQTPNSTSINEENVVHISGKREGMIFCPACEKYQSSNRDWCIRCGKFFVFEDEADVDASTDTES